MWCMCGGLRCTLHHVKAVQLIHPLLNIYVVGYWQNLCIVCVCVCCIVNGAWYHLTVCGVCGPT